MGNNKKNEYNINDPQRTLIFPSCVLERYLRMPDKRTGEGVSAGGRLGAPLLTTLHPPSSPRCRGPTLPCPKAAVGDTLALATHPHWLTPLHPTYTFTTKFWRHHTRYPYSPSRPGTSSLPLSRPAVPNLHCQTPLPPPPPQMSQMTRTLPCWTRYTRWARPEAGARSLTTSRRGFISVIRSRERE